VIPTRSSDHSVDEPAESPVQSRRQYQSVSPRRVHSDAPPAHTENQKNESAIDQIGRVKRPWFQYAARRGASLEVRAGATLKVRLYRARYDGASPPRVTLAPKTIINAGSVGEPRHGGVEATYAIIDTHSGDAELCRVPYGVEKTIYACDNAACPSKSRSVCGAVTSWSEKRRRSSVLVESPDSVALVGLESARNLRFSLLIA